MYSYGPSHMVEQKQDDQLEHVYSSYVRIRDVALKTCQRRWTIGRSGERGSGISVLAVRHDDNDDLGNCKHFQFMRVKSFSEIFLEKSGKFEISKQKVIYVNGDFRDKAFRDHPEKLVSSLFRSNKYFLRISNLYLDSMVFTSTILNNYFNSLTFIDSFLMP